MGIRELKGHDATKACVFCESRRAFKVRRKDNLEKHFTVNGLPKRRRFFKAHRGLEARLDEKHFKDLEESFVSAVHEAKGWLDWWSLEHLGEWTEPVHPQWIQKTDPEWILGPDLPTMDP